MAQLYVIEIVQMYHILTNIVSNRNHRFQAPFWQVLQKTLETNYILTALIILRQVDQLQE